MSDTPAVVLIFLFITVCLSVWISPFLYFCAELLSTRNDNNETKIPCHNLPAVLSITGILTLGHNRYTDIFIP